MTIAHCAAKFGGLKDIVDINPNILSQSLLECPDNDKNTPLHYAAEAGFLNQIPKPQLTKSSLLLRNRNGNTVILSAAHSGNIDQIPKEFITLENLLDANIYGENTFDLASISNTLDSLLEYIPTKVLNYCMKTFAQSDKTIAKKIENELKFRVKRNLQTENLENQESIV
jgi:ankyrin repeat protein